MPDVFTVFLNKDDDDDNDPSLPPRENFGSFFLPHVLEKGAYSDH